MTAPGPNLPFSPRPIAAVQLHQTGHSSIAQHFWRMKVGRRDFKAGFRCALRGGPFPRSAHLRLPSYALSRTIPIAIMAAASHLHFAPRSPRSSTPISIAQSTLVSRRAATRPTGARVKAQTATQ